jgi:hypothetical protein
MMPIKESKTHASPEKACPSRAKRARPACVTPCHIYAIRGEAIDRNSCPMNAPKDLNIDFRGASQWRLVSG